ncbi:hypothetical protein C5167_042048 [Papaver somniferum]|nr:hypothetical protein C5167_042048 [Papaver somniferum]
MNGDEWLTSLSRASVARLAETDKDLQDKGGYVVTMVSVGDSRCIIEIIIYSLSEDHRLKCNEEERDRITARSGEVGRLNIVGGAHVLDARSNEEVL